MSEPAGPGSVTRTWIADAMARCMPETATDGAGISLSSTAGDSEVFYASDELAGGLEQLQFTLGEGPSIEAGTTGTMVLVPDLRDARGGADRWPMFARESTGRGAGAFFAFPIRIGAVLLGTCAFYRRLAGPLDEGQLGRALSMSEQLGLAVLGLGGVDPAPPAADPAWSTLEVHRAAGMVMVQIDSSVDEALARIRGTAYAEDTSITLVAADVVAGRRRFSKEVR